MLIRLASLWDSMHSYDWQSDLSMMELEDGMIVPTVMEV